jgi:hypothetical protein
MMVSALRVFRPLAACITGKGPPQHLDARRESEVFLKVSSLTPG